MVLKPGKEAEAEAIFRKWGLDFADRRPDHGRPALPRHASAARSRPTCRSRSSATRRRSMTARMCRRQPPRRSIAADSRRPPVASAMRCCGCSARADLCSQALGVGAVRSPHPRQYGRSRRAATRRWSACCDGPKGLAMTCDVTPRYCEADPFEGGKQAVAEAWRNLTAVGALPLAVTDNLNFGNPERPEIMGQFVGCIARHRRGLPGARLPDRLRQCLALQRDQRARHPADADHRRRRPPRRCREDRDASPSRRPDDGDPADRRDRRAGSASRSGCARSRAARRARRRRSTSRPRSAMAISCARLIRDGHGHRLPRRLRWRPPRRARRDGDGVRHRRAIIGRRRRHRRRMPSGSARIRRAMS